jgi:hypothetical protein
MPLARTVVGRLFYDDFARADGPPGANYALSGAPTIVGGKLTIPDGARIDVIAAGTGRRDYHAQALVRRGSLAYYGRLLARLTPTQNFFYFIDSGATTDPNGNVPRFYSWTGAFNLLALGAAGQSGLVNSLMRLTLTLLGPTISAFLNGTVTLNANDPNPITQVVGTVSVGAQAGPVTCEHIIVCTTRSVIVTGLPAGWKIRCGALVSPAVVGAGAATLDLLDTQLPTAIDVLDATNTLIESTANVDGGDTYAWTPIVIPAPWQPADGAPASDWLRSDDLPGMRTRVWRLPAQTYAAANAFDYTRQDPEAEVWSLTAAIDFGAIAGQSTFLALLHEFTIIPKTREVYDMAVNWDDGMRIFVNGVKVWDNFGDGFGVFHLNLDFTDGEPKRIRVEQVQGPGVHHFAMQWSSASVALEAIPQKNLIPLTSALVADAAPASAWAVSA